LDNISETPEGRWVAIFYKESIRLNALRWIPSNMPLKP